jgi:hypothetical protein
MAHELDVRDSASADGLTIELADLLMTKLQVVSINEKDIRDLLALLIDHDLAPNEIRLERILEATKNDWGLEHTIHRSLSRLREMVDGFGLAADQQRTVIARIAQLDDALASAPKGTKWKLRARVGERVRWYEEPEEART